MTTEELIETFIQEGIKAYKKNYKETLLARCLNRHDTVVYEGNEFNYWRELSVYKTGQWFKEKFPDCSIEINLEGNDSNIQVEMTEEDVRKLTTYLYSFLKQYECV